MNDHRQCLGRVKRLGGVVLVVGDATERSVALAVQRKMDALIVLDTPSKVKSDEEILMGLRSEGIGISLHLDKK